MIVPAVNDRNILLQALHALADQQGDVRMEILVPERLGAGTREAVESAHPGVRILPMPPGTSIPAMRRQAMAAATAPVVAVIEDHVLVPPGWARAMLQAVATEGPVVGGWVRNAATERLVDRAAFLCEYGHMLRPGEPGPADGVTGNNVAYDADLLARFEHVLLEDRWEDRLHEAFRAAGIRLTHRPDIEVAHKMHYRSAFEYAGQRFLYSRAYAAMRVRDRGGPGRWLYGCGALLLPPLLLYRVVRNGWSTPRLRGDMMRALPLLALFVTSWAAGEIVGALAGPGNALGRVR